MDDIEHFEDNLNVNLSNSVALKNFIKAGRNAQKKLHESYNEHVWIDPITQG